MNLSQINLFHIGMNLRTPFVTHAGSVSEREAIIVEAVDQNGTSGWGDCVPFTTPFYTAETIDTAWHMLTNLFVPALNKGTITQPSDVNELLSSYKGHFMAKAGLEAALWDLYGKQNSMSLSKMIKGTKEQVEAGVVLSLEDDFEEKVAEYKAAGYKRYKLKVDKYKEREQIQQFRKVAPDVPVMFDGNGMYKEKDFDHLRSLDSLHILMIEQPFEQRDFYLHSKLQSQISTPICLDESVETITDTIQAKEFKSCSIINVKMNRVGGLTEALKIHDYSMSHNIRLWCGGMLDTGIGRAHNIALASLPGFSFPGDISESKRYWKRDIVFPEIKVENGEVKVPLGPGIGFDIDKEYIESLTKRQAFIKM
ncbi:O-succinylbenzoate synthase [Salirhabdus euzebyi]|uniref:o-succinylbenzoate synthase n=1 Tax=Salirhabdus euzebyi TaxID=394506 RepID=A0A841Q4W6_9BACI|nr:o-succinylbenzoate synthase [Salirhabdus euzebyi]MBB6453400.1 O-succinylbenzoate synthase [Salirhabdus euzebyi]